MAATMRYVLALVTTSIKESLALRAAFWMQAGAMLLNNVIFFSVWIIFFNRFESIGGWGLGHMALLYGLCSGSWGIFVVSFAGIRNLARAIVDGDLDNALILPRHPLARVGASRSQASGWGDLTTAIILISLSDVVSLVDLPLVAGFMLSGALIFASASAIANSLAFWLGSMDEFSRQLVEYLMIFSLYPNHVFGFWLKAMLLTLLPAAFIGTLPVETIVEGRWELGILVVGAAFTFAAIALLVFHFGLRRYSSGNRFGLNG